MPARKWMVISVILVWITAVRAEPISTPEGLEYCTVCHGSQLKGNANIGAPRLSGLSAWYIEKQLMAFKNGWRGTLIGDEEHPLGVEAHEMQTMVNELSDTQIKAIAKWASQTDAPLPVASITADAASGKQLFQNCVTCHGANAKGNQAIGAPALAGQSDWYLIRQLKLFSAGLRGSHADDISGKQMQSAMSLVVSDQQMADLTAYIQQIKQPLGLAK